MDVPPIIPTAADPAFGHSQYLLKRQLLKLVGGTFHIYDPSGTEVLVAHRKGFKLKEDIRILGGPGLTTELVGIFARQVLDFSAAYDVVDLRTQQKLAVFQRKGLQSLLRDEWIVLDAYERPFATMVEDSLALALVRRFLTNLVPQNYDFLVNGQRFLDLRQNFNPFTYHLNVDFEVPAAQLDRRVGLAGAILLACIEGRQRN